MRAIRFLSQLSLLALVALLCSEAGAQAHYPDRPVRVIVGFAAGGGADASARLIMKKMGEIMDANFVIENHGGAGGMPATALAADAKPDGYTLLWGSIGAFALSPALGVKPSYDPVNSFAPISLTASLPNVLVVGTNSPYTTVAQLVDAARKSPGALSFGTPGVGSAGHTSGQLLLSLANIKMTHLPYRGGSQLVNDVISGRVTCGFVTVSTVETLGRERLRPLAVTSAERNPVLGDVPTFAEAGVKGYDAKFWFGLLAPKGTPTQIIDQLNAAAHKALADPQVNAAHVKLGFVSTPSTPQQFAEQIQQDEKTWTNVLRGVATEK